VSVLLALVPFIIVCFGYWATYRSFFVKPPSSRPWAWQWRLLFPLFTSSATPLVVISRPTTTRYVPALAATVLVGLAIAIILMIILSFGEGGEGEQEERPEGHFFTNMRQKVKAPRGRRYTHITRARVVLVVGLLVILTQGAVSAFANARSTTLQSPAPATPSPSPTPPSRP